ncbi:hypothetical protein IV203_025298 [Nitzschia inconspicua]|uniref:Secreted protein n=1 Tax=Nitzschia inconspicua TaxID=303405 RepID=A0A9K3P9Q1_9STRA|nr:hypothetical protein IV203_024697 [Nitzschia inconspicua]KAG7362414.1 hypothetical protein IV203_025298 [Nitzschia inconspicua]
MFPHFGCFIVVVVAASIAYSVGAGGDRPKYEEWSNNEEWSGDEQQREMGHAQPKINDSLRKEVNAEVERHRCVLEKLRKKFSPRPNRQTCSSTFDYSSQEST